MPVDIALEHFTTTNRSVQRLLQLCEVTELLQAAVSVLWPSDDLDPKVRAKHLAASILLRQPRAHTHVGE